MKNKCRCGHRSKDHRHCGDSFAVCSKCSCTELYTTNESSKIEIIKESVNSFLFKHEFLRIMYYGFIVVLSFCAALALIALAGYCAFIYPIFGYILLAVLIIIIMYCIGYVFEN